MNDLFLQRCVEIDNGLASGNYVSALSLALTLPDICGRAMRGYDKPKDVHKRYTEWLDNFAIIAINDFNKDLNNNISLSSDDVYKLRCLFLHISDSHINMNNSNISKFILEYDISNNLYSKNLTVNGTVCTININNLCRVLRIYAEYYYKNNKNKFNFINDIEIVSNEPKNNISDIFNQILELENKRDK